MNIFAFFLIISMSFTIACQPSHPETVLGIKLGKLTNIQLAELEHSGKIEKDGDLDYINYADDLRADIHVYSINDADGNRIVDRVVLQFYNPEAKYPIDVKEKFIDPMLKDPILKMYQNKYGNGNLRELGGSEFYTWDKGDMIIKLSFHGYAIPFGGESPWYSPVTAEYRYNDNIQKKMKDKANSANSKI
ncbi:MULTISPECIES: hypothetical protein [Niastella]|uniref:Lipoprotein n=1 Tax=Niastella soli TaxID=2821487 RepID=A0ABS3Z6G2_9BACT|nr:hypothetical protein [Niastella soli]MBO9205270.1 hypothetical protein [Niastella soli]